MSGLLQCIIHEIGISEDDRRIPICEQANTDLFSENSDSMRFISKVLKCSITIYKAQYDSAYIFFRKSNSYYQDSDHHVRLIQMSNKYLLIKKDEILKLFFCAICSRWRKGENLNKFKSEHVKKCRRCECGTVYTSDTTDHELTCSKRKKINKGPKLASKKYKEDCIEKEEDLFRDIHHADFETHRGGHNGKHIVDTAVLKRDKDTEPKVFCGKGALKSFVKRIQRLKGILWFFNGGRFDLYMLLEYFIMKGIVIDHENTLLSSNQIITLGLFTRPKKSKNVKRLIIKDLAKFCPGSLHFNCVSTGIEDSEAKGSFDHNKVNSWEDVEKHKEERMKYAKLDVIAQSRVYEEAAKNYWRDYKLNMAKFVSLAQLSYAASTMFMPDNILFKVPRYTFNRENGLEDKMRNAYRGGRIITTVPYWSSSQYSHTMIDKIDNLDFTQQDFDSITDYLIYFDKVSLYPSVMYSQQYPCGKMNYNKDVKSFSSIYIKQIIREAEEMKLATAQLVEDNLAENAKVVVKKYVCKPRTEFKFRWKYTILCVDIDPPTEKQYIAFLMDRDKDGRNIQNFKPKRKYWVTGVELIESIILGYKLLEIHEYFSWEKVQHLFQAFISKSIQNKAEAKKETAAYLGPKNVMNSNSGKWAQRAIKKHIKLHIGEEVKPEMIANSSTTDMLYDKYNRVIAVVTQSENKVETSPYPLHISVFILAYSRELMSQFIRKIKGYTNPKHTPIYGDTDSLIVHRNAVELFNEEEKKIELGKDLGQMKDELDGGKVLSCIVLAPKTDMLMILSMDIIHGPLKEGEKRSKRANISLKFTSKGIPHTREKYHPRGNYHVSEEVKKEVLDIIKFQKERDNTKIKYKSVKLGEYYFFKTYKESKSEEVKDRLTWEDMEDLIYERCNILSIFGGMVRNLTRIDDIEDMGVNMDYNRRNIITEPWWRKGHRVLGEDYPREITSVVE